MTNDPKKMKRSASETSAQLLWAAGALFAKKGFHATSVSDIAKLAGVNRALISYHFGSKAGLYGALLDAAVADAAKAVGDLQFNPQAPDLERQLIHAFARVYEAQPHLAPMLLREHLDPDYFLDQDAAKKLRGFIGLTRQVLDSVPLRPEARDYDPQIVHLICIGSLIYFLITDPYRERMQGTLDPPPTRPQLREFVDILSDFLRRALRD